MSGIDPGEATRPRLARGLRLHHDAARGRTVLLGPERVLEPSGTALAVLELCDGTRDVPAIVDVLASRYATDRARIAMDVDRLLADLAGRWVVVL